MEQKRIDDLRRIYRSALLNDMIPFWIEYSLDDQWGRYLTCLDRDGSVYSTDKTTILQGRAIWAFSRLYNRVERRREWLDVARLGCEFISANGFDADGQTFFSVTRDGRPLRRRRYFFAEVFVAIGFAEFASASGDAAARTKSRELFAQVVRLYHQPELLPAKVFPETRPTKSLLTQLVLLTMCHELWRNDPGGRYDDLVEEVTFQIQRHFYDPRASVVVQTVARNGERLDLPEGRCLNPGHALETSWLLLHEALRCGDGALKEFTLAILDGILTQGWDQEYGGLFAYVDLEGKPPEQREWDMKLWWPHNEVLYATLLTHHRTGEAGHLEWFQNVHDWTFGHFPDPRFGRWYGYLHRGGSVALPVKGSLWKRMLHLPRCLFHCLTVLNEMTCSDGPSPAIWTG
ncbi:AGE family epimerase/isomerase [Candidatus Bipolaricaulota bacterium]|nr:AGE family epimerase/isomerase [Candidatus Bipolaricaulota bacterium]